MSETFNEKVRRERAEFEAAQYHFYFVTVKSVAEIIGWELVDKTHKDGELTYYRAELVNANGARIWFGLGRHHSEKALAYGDLDTAYGGNRYPSIGFSITKTAEQIARDIERRLLPKYMPLYEEQQERKDLKSAKCMASNEAMRKIAQIIGQPQTTFAGLEQGNSAALRTTYGTHIIKQIETYAGESFKVELCDMSESQVMEVVKAINAINKGEAL